MEVLKYSGELKKKAFHLLSVDGRKGGVRVAGDVDSFAVFIIPRLVSWRFLGSRVGSIMFMYKSQTSTLFFVFLQLWMMCPL